MELVLRQRLIGGMAIVGALVAGWYVAQESIGPVVLVCTAALLLIANLWSGIAPDVLVSGAVLVGYLVGNRGFAQLHVPNLPLLPAEIAMLLALVCGCWAWARAKQLPVRRDTLNLLLLGWMLLAAVRMPFDFRHHGIMALRDFAMVYYAAFFFFAQHWSSDAQNRRWLEQCLTVGFALVAPVFCAFLWQPEWFLKLAVSGVPLIFMKSDVAGACMAGAVLFFAHRYAKTNRLAMAAFTAIAFFGVVISNSRGALVAVFAGILWVVVIRAWRMLRLLIVITGLGLLTLVTHAAFSSRPLASTPLYRLYESIASVIDVRSQRTYQVQALSDKSDNNQFRLVWWRAVLDETWHHGRWLGLGFGHDIAREFVRIYYAEHEEFTTRSPHNFLLSVFGRTGVIGLTAFLMVLAAMTVRTWRAGRTFHEDPENERGLGLLLATWAILVSACFGVVLEGPMGAVVFWVALGMANAPTVHQSADVPQLADQNREKSPAPAGA